MTAVDSRSDDELLELAEVVLKDVGYAIERRYVEGRELLFAENADNVLALASMVTIPQLLEWEPLVSRALSARLANTDAGSKLWDAYIVLICAQQSDEELTDDLTEVTHNLRNLRRIVKVGVVPTNAGIARALRPLLPLPPPSSQSTLIDPLEQMRDLLERDRIDPQLVDEALEGFQILGRTAHEELTQSVNQEELGDA